MADGELLVLILSNGMKFGELAAVIEELKNKSKSIGTHARRELYWNAYTKMASKVSGMDGSAHCFLLYRAAGDGKVEITELTKRQKGQVTGGCEFLGAISFFSSVLCMCVVYSLSRRERSQSLSSFDWDGTCIHSNTLTLLFSFSCSLSTSPYAHTHTNKFGMAHIRECIHTCIPAYMAAYIHAYIHACINAYIHTCMQASRSNLPRTRPPSRGMHLCVCECVSVCAVSACTCEILCICVSVCLCVFTYAFLYMYV